MFSTTIINSRTRKIFHNGPEIMAWTTAAALTGRRLMGDERETLKVDHRRKKQHTSKLLSLPWEGFAHTHTHQTAHRWSVCFHTRQHRCDRIKCFIFSGKQERGILIHPWVKNPKQCNVRGSNPNSCILMKANSDGCRASDYLLTHQTPSERSCSSGSEQQQPVPWASLTGWHWQGAGKGFGFLTGR